MNNVKVILENMIEKNTDINMMESFKKLKDYTIILNEDIRIVNINKIIDKSIRETSFTYY